MGISVPASHRRRIVMASWRTQQYKSQPLCLPCPFSSCYHGDFTINRKEPSNRKRLENPTKFCRVFVCGTWHSIGRKHRMFVFGERERERKRIGGCARDAGSRPMSRTVSRSSHNTIKSQCIALAQRGCEEMI